MVHRRIRSGGPFEKLAGYCRAVVTDDGWIHVAGTVGQDHETGEVPDDVVDQCRLALGHIERALAEAGAGFEHAVRVTYVLRDVREFDACLPILVETFGDNPPAAMMIEAALIDPELKIEIEVTAKIAV